MKNPRFNSGFTGTEERTVFVTLHLRKITIRGFPFHVECVRLWKQNPIHHLLLFTFSCKFMLMIETQKERETHLEIGIKKKRIIFNQVRTRRNGQLF